jgi:hypothetical protein
MNLLVSETQTKEELEKLCEKITSEHQSEFDIMISEEKIEYDAFTKFVNLSERLMNNLTLAVNKFKPKGYSMLDVKYFQLTQFSIVLEFRTEFHKKNSQKLSQKYTEIE